MLAMVFTVIGTFQLFNEIYVLQRMTYVSNSIVPNMYIYANAFKYGNFNYAAAMSILLAAFTFILAVIFVRYSGFAQE